MHSLHLGQTQKALFQLLESLQTPISLSMFSPSFCSFNRSDYTLLHHTWGQASVMQAKSADLRYDVEIVSSGSPEGFSAELISHSRLFFFFLLDMSPNLPFEKIYLNFLSFFY